MTAAEHIAQAEALLQVEPDKYASDGAVQNLIQCAQTHALVAIAMSLQSTMTLNANITDVIEGK